MKIGVVGAGTMGAGIAQVAAQNGHPVVLVDLNQSVIDKARLGHVKVFDRLVEKGTMTEEQSKNVLNAIYYSTAIADLNECGLVS
jgi:3-hydroxybutyryl-CoA dehydrogenase